MHDELYPLPSDSHELGNLRRCMLALVGHIQRTRPLLMLQVIPALDPRARPRPFLAIAPNAWPLLQHRQRLRLHRCSRVNGEHSSTGQAVQSNPGHFLAAA
jgi:hypothetical protein